MMFEAGRGAVMGLWLVGALLATLQAGAFGLEAAAAAVGAVEGCQKAVPTAKVTLSFWVYGLVVIRVVLEPEVEDWSRSRAGIGDALVIPLISGVWGGVGDMGTTGAVKPVWAVLLVVLGTRFEDGAWAGVESTREMGPADPRLMFWERPWRLGEVFEVTLEFTDDMEALVLKEGCCPAPVLALPLMFLIAPREMVQAEVLVCRGWVSTGWVGFKRPAFEVAIGVGSVGWFVNWVRELENKVIVKATGSWFLYAVKARRLGGSLGQTKHCEMLENKEGSLWANKGASNKAIVHVVASLWIKETRDLWQLGRWSKKEDGSQSPETRDVV
jgi:hypothetical protein